MAGATAPSIPRERQQLSERAEPLPPAAERQAEMERVLGLRPGELDAVKCALRDQDYRAAQGGEIEKFWKGV